MFSIFPCVCWPSVCLLWRNVFLCLLIYLFILSCESCLYILEIHPFYIASFANIFSQFEVCLFILSFSWLCKGFCVFVCLFSWVQLFFFIFFSLGGGSKMILLRFMSKSVCLCFPLKRSIVSGLTFMSLIHYEFVFVFGVRKCSNSILLPVAVQFSQCHVLKRLSFLHCIVLPPLL